MRTHKLFCIALLGLLLLGSSSVQAKDPEDDPDQAAEAQGDSSAETSEDTSEETDEKPKEKTTELEEEKDVLILHINNFDRALSEYKYLLVEFCK